MHSKWQIVSTGFMAVCALFLLQGCASPSKGQRDAVLTDSGFWSYPRYTLRFPAVVLTNGSSQEFQFVAPTHKMTFVMELGVNPASIEREAALQTLVSNRVKIRVQMHGSRGRTVVDVAPQATQWTVSKALYYWHLWIRETCGRWFWRGATYSLTIQASSDMGEFPATTVRPFLKGGGNELP